MVVDHSKKRQRVREWRTFRPHVAGSAIVEVVAAADFAAVVVYLVRYQRVDVGCAAYVAVVAVDSCGQAGLHASADWVHQSGQAEGQGSRDQGADHSPYHSLVEEAHGALEDPEVLAVLVGSRSQEPRRAFQESHVGHQGLEIEEAVADHADHPDSRIVAAAVVEEEAGAETAVVAAGVVVAVGVATGLKLAQFLANAIAIEGITSTV